MPDTPASSPILSDADRALLRQISQELQTLNQQRVLTSHNHWGKLLSMQLLKGMALGLGSALGATLALSLFIFLLSQMAVVPFIGELANDVLQEMGKYQP